MASTKVTFTLDPATIARLQDSGSRRSMPKSEVVREAIHDFHERIGQLSERDRLRMLRTFDEMVPRIPSRSLRTVTNELSAIRRARKAGGRKN